MSEAPEFNLVRDPWLPVTTMQGATDEWSLQQFFQRAHEAQALNEPSPLTYTAILRLLLAIAHRALQGPATNEHWYELWERRDQGFNQTVFDSYLDKWQHRFNLFDPVVPFGQVADFDPNDEGSPMSRLVLEQTSGSNSTLFDHSRDDTTPPVSAAAAARALLGAHHYAFAGTAGRYMQAPLVAGYAVSWMGTTLYETLVLNLVLYDRSLPPMLGMEGDMPFWEDGDPAVPNKHVCLARGLTDLYTFRGRRLQLIPDGAGNVRRVRYEQGLVLDLLNEQLRDPFKRYTAQKQANALLPRNFSENRALWRDSDGLIESVADAGVENEPPTVIRNLRDRLPDFEEELASLSPHVLATGLVNNQARVSLWRMDRMTLPLSILGDKLRRASLHEAIRYAESAWTDALRPAARIFASVGLAGENGKPDGKDVTAIISRIAIEQRYWSRVDREFQSFLTELGGAADSADTLDSWKERLRNLCEICFRDATITMVGKRWYQAQSAGAIYLYSQLKRIGLIAETKEEAPV